MFLFLHRDTLRNASCRHILQIRTISNSKLPLIIRCLLSRCVRGTSKDLNCCFGEAGATWRIFAPGQLCQGGLRSGSSGLLFFGECSDRCSEVRMISVTLILNYDIAVISVDWCYFRSPASLLAVVTAWLPRLISYIRWIIYGSSEIRSHEQQRITFLTMTLFNRNEGKMKILSGQYWVLP